MELKNIELIDVKGWVAIENGDTYTYYSDWKKIENIVFSIDKNNDVKGYDTTKLYYDFEIEDGVYDGYPTLEDFYKFIGNNKKVEIISVFKY